MIHEDSQLVFDFFDQNVYYPLMLEHSITVSWPDGLDEFICDCKTSLVTRDIIEQALKDSGKWQGEDDEDDEQNVEL